MSLSSSSGEEEDEGGAAYRRGGYHAVRVGDPFAGGRYIVQRKLGWGHSSTVWLAYDTRCRDHLARMMELLGKIPRKVIAMAGTQSKDYFDRHGGLKRIRRLKFWSLDRLLVEKYKFSDSDAHELSDFLRPLLDFEPENRPTAGMCLQSPWIKGSYSKPAAETTESCLEGTTIGMSKLQVS